MGEVIRPFNARMRTRLVPTMRAHAFFDSIAFDAFWRRVTPETK